MSRRTVPLGEENTHTSGPPATRMSRRRCRTVGPVEPAKLLPTDVSDKTASICADNDRSRTGAGTNRGARRLGIAGQPWVVFRQSFQAKTRCFEDRILGLFGGDEGPDLRVGGNKNPDTAPRIQHHYGNFLVTAVRGAFRFRGMQRRELELLSWRMPRDADAQHTAVVIVPVEEGPERVPHVEGEVRSVKRPTARGMGRIPTLDGERAEAHSQARDEGLIVPNFGVERCRTWWVPIAQQR